MCMPSVLFVCTANQCRSPVAAALFQQHLRRANLLAAWRVESAGTWAESGRSAHPQMQVIARSAGLDLGRHRAQGIEDMPHLPTFDLVLTMARNHQEALQAEFPGLCERIYLLGSLAGKPFDIPDPVGNAPLRYQQTFEQIEQVVQAAFPRILALTQRPRAISAHESPGSLD
jgi:protein-tyrosine-phosphatase